MCSVSSRAGNDDIRAELVEVTEQGATIDVLVTGPTGPRAPTTRDGEPGERSTPRSHLSAHPTHRRIVGGAASALGNGDNGAVAEGKPVIPNVLAGRYASLAMATFWSPEHKIVLERRLWVAVLRAQQDLGVDVPDGSLQSTKR